MLIGHRYALKSERVIFYSIIPDQGIKIGRHWSGVGRLSGVNVALNKSYLPLFRILPCILYNLYLARAYIQLKSNYVFVYQNFTYFS